MEGFLESKVDELDTDQPHYIGFVINSREMVWTGYEPKNYKKMAIDFICKRKKRPLSPKRWIPTKKAKIKGKKMLWGGRMKVQRFLDFKIGSHIKFRFKSTKKWGSTKKVSLVLDNA